MKLLLAIMVLFLILSGIAFAQAPVVVPPFPGSPSANQEVIGPDGQIYVWDGTKWVHGAATPALITDAALASAYSGVGTCPASQFVTALARNAAPTCAPAGGGVTVGTTAPSTPSAGALWYDTTSGQLQLKVWNGAAWVASGGGPWLPVNNPTFTGVLAGPQASIANTPAGADPLDMDGNRNASYETWMANWSNGNQAFVGYSATNNAGNAAYLIMTSSAYTGAGGNWEIPDTLQLSSSGAGGLILATSNTATNNVPVRIFIGSYEQARFSLRGLTLPYAAGGSSLNFGTDTTPRASLTSQTAGTLQLAGGAWWNNTNWIATSTTPSMIEEAGGTTTFYNNTGATVGAAFTPVSRGFFNTTGLNLPLNTPLFLGTFASLSSSGSGVFNLSGTARYNGTNWIATAATAQMLEQSGPGNIGFLSATAVALNANVGAWAPQGNFNVNGFNASHINNDTTGMGAPTATGGASFYAGSRDTAGEVIAPGNNPNVQVFFNRAFPSDVSCTLTADGQPYYWYTTLKTRTSVQFNCLQANGAACPNGQYVQYHCFGLGP